LLFITINRLIKFAALLWISCIFISVFILSSQLVRWTSALVVYVNSVGNGQLDDVVLRCSRFIQG